MDPDALRNPRGPLPAWTYWRRRALLAVGVVLVLFLLVRACSGGGDDSLTPPAGREVPGSAPGSIASATAPSSTAPSPTAPTSAAPRPTPLAASTPCTDAELAITATADKAQYAVGARSRLTLQVRNTSSRSCRRDLGPAQRELLVTSGSDRIWSSDDCAPGGRPAAVTLLPGQTAAFGVDWPGTRSRPGCPAGGERAVPGTYRVAARLGSLRQLGAVFRIV